MSNDPVHSGQADRWGGWSWHEPIRGEHFRRCSYCGSIHPDDLAAEPEWASRWADPKYGWPHKFYVDIPNRDPDALFVTGGSNSVEKPTVGPDEWLPVDTLSAEQRQIADRDGWRGEHDRWISFGTRPNHFGKFYTVHLADPAIADEVKERIMARSGLRFSFIDGRVSWSRYEASA